MNKLTIAALKIIGKSNPVALVAFAMIGECVVYNKVGDLIINGVDKKIKRMKLKRKQKARRIQREEA